MVHIKGFRNSFLKVDIHKLILGNLEELKDIFNVLVSNYNLWVTGHLYWVACSF